MWTLVTMISPDATNKERKKKKNNHLLLEKSLRRFQTPIRFVSLNYIVATYDETTVYNLYSSRDLEFSLFFGERRKTQGGEDR